MDPVGALADVRHRPFWLDGPQPADEPALTNDGTADLAVDLPEAVPVIVDGNRFGLWIGALGDRVDVDDDDGFESSSSDTTQRASPPSRSDSNSPNSSSDSSSGSSSPPTPRARTTPTGRSSSAASSATDWGASRHSTTMSTCSGDSVRFSSGPSARGSATTTAMRSRRC